MFSVLKILAYMFERFIMRSIENGEVILENKKYITSKTDLAGYITYVNDYFCEISGYSKEELIGKNHNIIRHPDMPKIVFKFMWDRLNNDEGIYAYVKNLAKDGSHYWVIADVEIVKKKDVKVGYYSFRSKANQKGVDEISKVYALLIEKEEEGGMELSSKVLQEFLESKNMSYDEYINYLMGGGGKLRAWYAILKKLLRF